VFRLVWVLEFGKGLRWDILGLGEGKWVLSDGHWVLVTGRKEFGEGFLGFRSFGGELHIYLF